MIPDWHTAVRSDATNLLGRYAALVDSGAPDEVGSLFGAEGRLIITSGRVLRGAVEIGSFVADSRSRRQGVPIRHHVASIEVHCLAPDRAGVRAYFQALSPQGLDHWGRYEDQLHVIDGHWKFECRRVTVEGAVPHGWMAAYAAG